MGNIFFDHSINIFLSVHPHVCGEHLTDEKLNECSAGSSPRVWGTSACMPCVLNNRRFIPTCVGNIQRVRHIGLLVTVHPHVCGEHTETATDRPVDDGSSPRVWGTLPANEFKDACERFIPTCVGNMSP